MFFYKTGFVFYFLFFAHKIACSALSCEVSAPNAVLINAETGKILFEKNSQVACYPASTTKLATALYVVHKQESVLDRKVTASWDALATVSSYLRRNSGKHPSYRLEYGGTHMGIKAGEVLDLHALLCGAMLPSGNDAANVLAEAISGSVPVFMEELNDFLRGIGCVQTSFTNPHGLPDTEHMTTARDLAKIACAAFKYPVLREIMSSKERERPVTNKQPASKLIQTNALLKAGKYFYPYATGMKTGYTMQSGYNLIASAEKGDRKLIAVICHCDELSQRYRSAVQLFEMAFNEVKQTRKLLSKEHDIFHVSLEGAKSRLDAFLQEDVGICFYPSEEKSFRYTVHWLQKELPISEGEEVGFIQLLDQDNALEKTVALLAAKPVLPTFSYRVKKETDYVLIQIKTHRVYLGYFLAAVLLMGCLWRLQGKQIRRKLNKLLQR